MIFDAQNHSMNIVMVVFLCSKLYYNGQLTVVKIKLILKL